MVAGWLSHTEPASCFKYCSRLLGLHDLILLFNGSSGASGAHLLQLGVIWTMNVLVVLDGILVGLFELGLEEVVAGGHGGRVGATLGLGEVVWKIIELGIAWSAPRYQSTSVVARMHGGVRSDVRWRGDRRRRRSRRKSEEERAADEVVLDRRGHKIKTYQLPLP